MLLLGFVLDQAFEVPLYIGTRHTAGKQVRAAKAVTDHTSFWSF